MPTPIPAFLAARPTFARQTTDASSVLPLTERPASQAGTPTVDVLEPPFEAPQRRWHGHAVPALPRAQDVQPYARPVAQGLFAAAMLGWMIALTVQVTRLWHVPMCEDL